MTDPFKYKQQDDKTYIWDQFRKKYFLLTKEEWVRQNMLLYMVTVKKYPQPLISIEKKITVGHTTKRYDALVYKNDLPWLLLECKEENTPLDKHVLQQVLAYKSVLDVQYITVGNGHDVLSYHVTEQIWFNGFPDYEDL